MVSFNAITSPLPLPYCFRICLMLWRPGYMSLLGLIFGNLLMYRETNLLNLVDVWLRALYVSTIVRLCPVIDRFTIISRTSSGSDSSLTSSATSPSSCSSSVVLVVVVLVFLPLAVVVVVAVHLDFQSF